MQTPIERFEEGSVGDLVSEDYRRADIFKSFGIDFCCGGKKTLKEACLEKGLDIDKVKSALNELALQPTGARLDYRKWELDFLCDYIVNTHHQYVHQAVPHLKAYTEKVASVHGSKHPELFQISEHFESMAGEMVMHMRKEELVLFPYIKKLVAAKKSGNFMEPPPFGSVINPVQAMEAEHESAAHHMRAIGELSNNFTVPEDGCTTYRVLFASLKEFEEDLHQHVHLENNILFPGAIKLEKELFNDREKTQ